MSPFHKRVRFTISHQASVDLVVWHVYQAFENHDSRHEKDLLLVGKAKVSRAVVQVVQYVILAYLVLANTVYSYTVFGICSSAALPRRSYQRHWLE